MYFDACLWYLILKRKLHQKKLIQGAILIDDCKKERLGRFCRAGI